MLSLQEEKMLTIIFMDAQGQSRNVKHCSHSKPLNDD